jgi:hypothetical protein
LLIFYHSLFFPKPKRTGRNAHFHFFVGQLANRILTPRFQQGFQRGTERLRPTDDDGAVFRAAKYYWMHRKASAYAATPLAFCAVFILVGMFESVYAPFSAIGCTYLLVQAPLWRADLSRSTAERIDG